MRRFLDYLIKERFREVSKVAVRAVRVRRIAGGALIFFSFIMFRNS